MTKKSAQQIQSQSQAGPSKEDPPVGDWPSTVRTRQDLDDALELGSASGVSEQTVEDILAEVMARYPNAKI